MTDVLVDGVPLTRERFVAINIAAVLACPGEFDVAESLPESFARNLSAYLTRWGIEHEVVGPSTPFRTRFEVKEEAV